MQLTQMMSWNSPLNQEDTNNLQQRQGPQFCCFDILGRSLLSVTAFDVTECVQHYKGLTPIADDAEVVEGSKCALGQVGQRSLSPSGEYKLYSCLPL